jgi:hypothetical protein
MMYAVIALAYAYCPHPPETAVLRMPSTIIDPECGGDRSLHMLVHFKSHGAITQKIVLFRNEVPPLDSWEK